MNNQWTTSPWREADLYEYAMQSHPLCRMRFSHYQASSAALEWQKVVYTQSTIQSRMIACVECVSTTMCWYMVTWGMSGVLGWWVAVPACARHTSLTPTHVPHDGSPQRHRRGDCLRREVDIRYPAQVLIISSPPPVCVCVCVHDITCMFVEVDMCR